MTRRRCAVLIVAFAFFSLFTADGVAGELLPRSPLPKPPVITKPPFESRLTVKFSDDLKVRSMGGNLISLVGASLSNIEALQAQYNLTFDPLIKLPQQTLDLIETRAAARSAVAQPDLAGMMVVHAPEHAIKGVTVDGGKSYGCRAAQQNVMKRRTWRLPGWVLRSWRRWGMIALCRSHIERKSGNVAVDGCRGVRHDP